jgi:hypothetical protein
VKDETILLREIKEAAHVIGIAPTTLCQRAVKNGALVQRLEDGGTVTAATIRKIREWISKHRPKLRAAE